MPLEPRQIDNERKRDERECDHAYTRLGNNSPHLSCLARAPHARDCDPASERGQQGRDRAMERHGAPLLHFQVRATPPWPSWRIAERSVRCAQRPHLAVRPGLAGTRTHAPGSAYTHGCEVMRWHEARSGSRRVALVSQQRSAREISARENRDSREPVSRTGPEGRGARHAPPSLIDRALTPLHRWV